MWTATGPKPGRPNEPPRPSESKDQPEPELHESLEPGLRGAVAVDAPEVRRPGVCAVLTLVVLRAVEEIERLETQLEPHAIGDRRRLREVHVEHEHPRAAELVVAVHRGAALEVRADQEVGLGAPVRGRHRQQIVVARRRVALADARLHAVDELPVLLT